MSFLMASMVIVSANASSMWMFCSARLLSIDEVVDKSESNGKETVIMEHVVFYAPDLVLCG